MSEQYSIGRRGEEQACAYLQALGMQVVHTRYRKAGGEIDIIALDHGTVCFVEVKYRPDGRIGDGIGSVTPAKMRRIRSAAFSYLQTLPKKPKHRFDILEITRAGILYTRSVSLPGQRSV
ncbi:MAG: YraN family protein [Christensenellales bacterium]|jgi:putative endonuclease